MNVVRGDMSLVGPRPDMASAVARYEPWQLERHTVKPGLTGVWQVEQRHERGELREFAAVDIAYARAVSFRLDLRVLLRTPIALVRRPAPRPAERGARERAPDSARSRRSRASPDPLDR